MMFTHFLKPVRCEARKNIIAAVAIISAAEDMPPVKHERTFANQIQLLTLTSEELFQTYHKFVLGQILNQTVFSEQLDEQDFKEQFPLISVYRKDSMKAERRTDDGS